jgi:hypothetical protein
LRMLRFELGLWLMRPAPTTPARELETPSSPERPMNRG